LWLLLSLPLHCPPNWNFLEIERLLVAYGFGKNLYTSSMLVFFPKLCEFCSFFLILKLMCL
jgi:hypothetical protein